MPKRLFEIWLPNSTVVHSSQCNILHYKNEGPVQSESSTFTPLQCFLFGKAKRLWTNNIKSKRDRDSDPTCVTSYFERLEQRNLRFFMFFRKFVEALILLILFILRSANEVYWHSKIKKVEVNMNATRFCVDDLKNKCCHAYGDV